MTLKAGVAGAGVFGGYHANKYAEAADADLVAIYDPDPDRAAMAATMHGCDACTDYSDFLSKIDLLTIAAPASFHYELALRALKAGRHCLIEKPIALNVADADRLIEVAKAENLVLQIGHQERYVFDAFGILSRTDTPREVRSRRLNKFSGRAMDVSVVFDLMIHDLDMLGQIAEGPVESLTASEVCEHGPHGDRTEAEIIFAGGLKASLAASRLEETPTRDMTLVYDDGEIVIDFLKREITNTTGTPLALEFGAENAPLAFRDPLAFGTQSFIRSVMTGDAPIVSGTAGRAALDLAIRIEQAAA